MTIDWNGIIIAVISGILGLLGTIITAFLVPWLKAKAESIKNENARKAAELAIDMAGDTVVAAVNATSQTLVAQYKKNGTWDDEAKKKVKEEVINQIEASLTAEEINAIATYSKMALRDWIAQKVEAYIKTDDPNATTK
jgi:type II secretory pathway pseudopilin PulG